MINEAKQNIDLVSVVESTGVELQKRGARYCGLCPFHAERTPSFFVFPDNHFKCFGCGISGDCIDFIQRLHGLSFQDALKHLGIKRSETTPQMQQDIKKRKRCAELVKKFRQWEWDYCTHISSLWFEIKRLMVGDIPPEDLELYAPLLHMLPIWEYHREILIHGTDKEKFKLYKEAQNAKGTAF